VEEVGGADEEKLRLLAAKFVRLAEGKPSITSRKGSVESEAKKNP